MSTFSKRLLSGSPASGRPILVVPIVSPGLTIHTAVAGAADFDEIWLWAQNADTQDRTLTIEWGGLAAPDDLIDAITLSPNSGLIMIAPGLPLNGGLIVTAFAEVASQINIFGYVNRITQ